MSEIIDLDKQYIGKIGKIGKMTFLAWAQIGKMCKMGEIIKIDPIIENTKISKWE